jgi:hypothetical protein
LVAAGELAGQREEALDQLVADAIVAQLAQAPEERIGLLRARSGVVRRCSRL